LIINFKNMEQGPKKKKYLEKNLSKEFIIALVLIVISIFSWAGLTKAGFIPNYLDVDFLCPIRGTLRPSFTPGTNGSPGVVAFKPVIYLYPEQNQRVEVKLNYKGTINTSYPEYKNGWNVIAYPNGKVINISDNKEYSYLFWEGTDENAKYNLSSGFIVKGSETADFLQNKLAKFGMMPKEYNEFIVYWLPKMQDNKYNLIHFASRQEYDERASLSINPEPDSILRVFMAFKKINKEIEIKPQDILPFERKGFSVIEWGGTEIK
jgi:hypothetical protein